MPDSPTLFPVDLLSELAPDAPPELPVAVSSDRRRSLLAAERALLLSVSS